MALSRHDEHPGDKHPGANMAPPSEETYRGTLEGHTPDGSRATMIVTRQGLGRTGRVWLTFLGALKTTQVMTDDETNRLVALLRAARGPQ